LGIPLYTLNFDAIFKKAIVDDFLKVYASGQTPNPCVRCNKYIKFGELLRKVRALGTDYLATGHYVRLRRKTPNSKFQIPKFELLMAKDKEKDQSYFLYNLGQQEFKHLLFPIGDYTKTEVRKLAMKFGLPTAEKRESQEVCFIPERDHNEFLKRHLKLKPGKIVTVKGSIVGQHLGLPLYTLGQRRGIGLGGGPYYVIDFNQKKNQLIVTSNLQDPGLYQRQLKAKAVNWVSGQTPKLPLKCLAKVRYRQALSAAVVSKSGKDYLVKFNQPQRAVMPGQSVVFYKKTKKQKNKKTQLELLGGGIIK
jgi:tRNA-specific 2-thiouridylase